MITSHSEDLLVGLVALGLVPWIAWTVRRGVREGRLPIGRAYVARDERPGPFKALLFVYIAAALLIALIAADLLFNIDIGPGS
jgi:hypothetical protein